ncbi:MAG: dipeptidase [Pseudomonadales bacterium]
MQKLTIARLAGFICATLFAISSNADDDLTQRAADIAQKYPIIDTHIDVPYRLHDHWQDVTQATDRGDFDYPRAVKGGLSAPFMSIYIPSSLEAEGGGVELANQLIDQVEAITARAPDKFSLIRRSEDVMTLFNQGKIGLAMGMENGSPIAGDLKNLDHFYARGIRYITLTHAQANHIADSSYDEVRLWNGLSPFGKELVGAMNAKGMIVDISHVSDAAFYEVLEVSTAPVVASHSSARHFTPGWERNMSDAMIKALGKKDGVIMINFGSSFLTDEARKHSDNLRALAKQFANRNTLDEHDPKVKQYAEAYKQKSPFPYAMVDDVADHIDRVVKLAGIDHVGLGSDFDGVGDTLPTGLKDVSMYPNLIAALLKRGYKETDIEKILYQNFLRVWRAVEARAEE